jgi:uncharacterized repeat protein (TIGR01451 family)
MRPLFATLFILFLSSRISFSQTYVTIPDANFVNWLNTNYPACMNGNQMNINCTAIQNATIVNVSSYNISNLFGIQYFTSLAILNCSSNQLTSLPSLPTTLVNLNCFNNNLTSLPALPNSLLILNCSTNSNLISFPSFPPNLQSLTLGGYNMSSVVLPPLPTSLVTLDIQFAQLSQLPPLPPNLQTLYCGNSPLGILPPLPSNLITLGCVNNGLSSLPAQLPANLQTLICDQNNFLALPNLPNTLNQLQCSNIPLLSQLPALPNGLTTLVAQNNSLTSLSALPNSLTYLDVDNNQLTSLPVLSSTVINNLFCSNNSLQYLPQLPNTILILDVTNNQITCFEPFPTSLSSPNIGNNPFTCLPNYIPSMSVFGLTGYPLCEDGDLVNNPFGCTSAKGISGNVFGDVDINCTQNNSEVGIKNIGIKLFDQQGSFISSTTTANGSGRYFLSGDTTSYNVVIDTLGIPYNLSCSSYSVETGAVLTSSAWLIDDLNYGLICKPGYDIGIQSLNQTGWVFPGQVHQLQVVGGDLSQWYGLTCAAGVSGTMTLAINGPVNYVSPAAGALTPSTVIGNQITYTFADVSQVDMNNAFKLLFTVDTTAQAGDLICVNVSFSSAVNGDNNPSNNTYSSCYNVINSYDPNMKTAWPQNVEPGFDGYFNYTIYFQNTGNAPAFNIRLADTLDNNLDLSTFQVVHYSHPNIVYLNEYVMTVRFNNIMLPDSSSNPEGSIGYIQYRIKPLSALSLGTTIENTAFIYFDFNPPIITNTTVNEYVDQVSSISETSDEYYQIFPNPSKGIVQISVNNYDVTTSSWIVMDYSGRTIIEGQLKGKDSLIDLTTLSRGNYILMVKNELEQIVRQIIID